MRPVIDEFVFPKSLHEGQRYNVLCTVIKGDAPLEIQWLHNGILLPINNNLKSISGQLKGVTVSQVTEFSSMLNFASLLSEHRGNYTCKATNVAGSASYTAKMEIQGNWKNLNFYQHFEKCDLFYNSLELLVYGESIKFET